ncbi:hypothetical protein PQX77_011971 [Marasmius sp. AFHP31]|nr:hypothetical protein PQX77_011971 [Marasmius sp. AFHP31]
MFAAQGRHHEARECYTKAVDVTPQMAFQLIKALRAEGVKYIVAPYEADAQLAFLEKQRIVSAILTEDSDLLVFGCKNVLFKLDITARTVVSISKADFASVTPSADSSAISLVGWSERQFREMAILSGCDYLSSIPGIGLKTACTLLRKWKTPEQVVRSLMLEGKKMVPKGYVRQFRMAEKCFLYQRVYDPRLERLVHLHDVPEEEEWDEVVDNYVGKDLEPSLAKAVALGDKDPVSYEDMKDLNPGFVPRTRVLHDITVADKSANRSAKSKGKMKETSEGILSFFGPNPKIPQIPKSPSTKSKAATEGKSKMVVGKQSGKRTLADIHDQDLQARKKKRTTPTKPTYGRSKFFVPSGDRALAKDTLTHAPGPSRLSQKENEHIAIDEESIGAEDTDSLVAQYPVSLDEAQDLEEDFEVEQEDGYISPTPSRSQDTPELSSPPRPTIAPELRQGGPDPFVFGVESISSPPSGGRSSRHPRTQPAAQSNGPIGRILIEASPEPEPKASGMEVEELDLRSSFDELTETEFSEDECTPTPLSYSPPTPDLDRDLVPAAPVGEAMDDPEEQEERAMASKSAAVAAGWRNMWSLTPSRTTQPLRQHFVASLRRSGTNVTPSGRHRVAERPCVLTVPPSSSHERTPHTIGKPLSSGSPAALQSRRSLVFVETKTKTGLIFESSVESLPSMRTSGTNPQDPEVDGLARARLQKFRRLSR